MGRAGEHMLRFAWWPFHPEDVYVSWPAGEIYSLTEDPRTRMVMGVPLSALGL